MLAKFLLDLDGPLGWKDNQEIVENQQMQEDLLVEMNIPTYNNFKYFLFWDVIQALTKKYQIEMELENKVREKEEKKGAQLTDKEIYQMKFLLNLEMEFDHHEDKQKNILALKEVHQEELKLLKKVKGTRDELFSSVHIKAAKTILKHLKNYIAMKRDRELHPELYDSKRMRRTNRRTKQAEEKPSNNQGQEENENIKLIED